MILKAYLPIVRHARVSKSDAAWFAERGVDRPRLAAALAVLRAVRRHVIPLHRKFTGVAFLVHDRESGVPCQDRRGYIDITLDCGREKNIRKTLPKRWRFVRPAPSDERDNHLFGLSAWYLGVVLSCESAKPKMTDVDVLKVVGQHAHYLANMTQLVVS